MRPLGNPEIVASSLQALGEASITVWLSVSFCKLVIIFLRPQKKFSIPITAGNRAFHITKHLEVELLAGCVDNVLDLQEEARVFNNYDFTYPGFAYFKMWFN
jgi:hypothetical protein